jgi:lysophospholipase L1-like esterase
MRRELGGDFLVIEEGLNGRTTVWDDPLVPGRNGNEYLVPCLNSHRPLDFVVLFLGTNDLKKRFSASAQDIAQGVGVLAGIVASSAAGPRGGTPVTLILAPPPLGKLTGYAETFENGGATSARLSARIREIALELNCEFLDTSELIVTSDIDGIHFDPPAHEVLGCAVARRIMMLSRPNHA